MHHTLHARDQRAPGRKPACAVPGAHASRAYPSDSARCRSRHRLTHRCTDGYEPSNPWLAQPLPHPHDGMPLLAREPGISGRPPLDGSRRTPNQSTSGPPRPPAAGRNPPSRRNSATVVRDTCSPRVSPCPALPTARYAVAQASMSSIPFLPGTSKTVTGTRESTGKPDGIDALSRNRPHRPK